MGNPRNRSSLEFLLSADEEDAASSISRKYARDGEKQRRENVEKSLRGDFVSPAVQILPAN